VSYTWDSESILSTLALFFGCPEASFIGIHKICLVRFYLPRESTQETRRIAWGPLWTRRKELHFPNQNSSFSWSEDIPRERKENGLYQLLYSGHSNQLRRESTCNICLTCSTDPYLTLYIDNFCLVCTRYLERELDWAFHFYSLSSYYIPEDQDHYGLREAGSHMSMLSMRDCWLKLYVYMSLDWAILGCNMWICPKELIRQHWEILFDFLCTVPHASFISATVGEW